jgi:uncharacterized membrane protein (UPF0127 family)
MRPWRIPAPVSGAKVVIELPEGFIAQHNLQCDQRLTLTSYAPPEFDIQD